MKIEHMNSDNMWSQAWDTLNGIITEDPVLTLDQQLKIVEIQAILALGQELSRHADTLTAE